MSTNITRSLSVPLRIMGPGSNVDIRGWPRDIVRSARHQHVTERGAVVPSSRAVAHVQRIALETSTVVRDVHPANAAWIRPAHRGGSRSVPPVGSMSNRSNTAERPLRIRAKCPATVPHGGAVGREVAQPLQVRTENLDATAS